MKELEDFINKEKQKEYLEIFLILCELLKTEEIISFTYKNKIFTVQVSDRDYYRYNLKGGEDNG